MHTRYMIVDLRDRVYFSCDNSIAYSFLMVFAYGVARGTLIGYMSKLIVCAHLIVTGVL